MDSGHPKNAFIYMTFTVGIYTERERKRDRDRKKNPEEPDGLLAETPARAARTYMYVRVLTV